MEDTFVAIEVAGLKKQLTSDCQRVIRSIQFLVTLIYPATMNMFAVKNIIRYDEDLSIKNILFFSVPWYFVIPGCHYANFGLKKGHQKSDVNISVMPVACEQALCVRIAKRAARGLGRR